MEAVATLKPEDQGRTCKGCAVHKPLHQFKRRTDGNRYYRGKCKTCRSAEQAAKYQIKKPKLRGYKQDYYRKHKAEIELYQKNYREKNKARLAAKAQIRNSRSRARINLYRKNRLATNPAFKMRKNLSARIRDALRGKCESLGTRNLLGCSIPDFIIYLESRFEVGMSWENYGRFPGWHVDHIMPCAIFDLSKPEHQKRCFHFSNCQPMWASQNQKKSAKVLTQQFNLL